MQEAPTWCQKLVQIGPASYGECGYRFGHLGDCKRPKMCKACGGAMDPDKILDYCRTCEPEMNRIFDEEVAKMSESSIPPAQPPEDLDSLMLQWNEEMEAIKPLAEQLAPHIKKEQELRRKIAPLAFPPDQKGNMPEGTNYKELNAGWRLKANLKIKRDVDEAALPAVREQLEKMLVNPDALFKVEHSLALKEYRGLTEEQKAIVEQALVIKPQMPELEIVPPKTEKEKVQ